MSEFTSTGHEPYPNFHLDRQKLLQIGEMGISGYIYGVDHLESQVGLYTRFLSRSDVMPSHRERANGNLDRYMFELAWREGVYDDHRKTEDEVCNLEI